MDGAVKTISDGGLAIQQVFYADPDRYPPIINGTRLLAMAGYATEIFCRFTEVEIPVELPEGVSIVRIDSRAESSWREYLGFIREVIHRGSKRANLFVGHDMHGFLAAWLLSRLYRRPLVYHCHDLAENVKGPGRFVKLFEQIFARTADLVIVPDLERGKVVAKALALKRLPLIVANAPLRVSRASSEDLPQALAVQGRQYERILLRQGSIGPGHALESTIRSIPLWADRGWGFVLVGMGTSEYLDELGHLASELAVGEQLAILPPVSYDEVLRLTPGADAGHALYEPIHINHLHATTASNKMMEYMAAGLPLLVSDKPDLCAFVEAHGCGVTADESSPESIAAAVNALLGDPDLARRLGAAGARAFEQEFNYEQQFAPVLEAVRGLIDAGRGAHA
jgi:glycosyltransferase involved in cell wall biosynthesis